MSSSFSHVGGLKVEKDFNIQLNASQLRLHQRKQNASKRQSLEVHVHAHGASRSEETTKSSSSSHAELQAVLEQSASTSTISTTAGSGNEENEMLRKVLNGTKKTSSRASSGTAPIASTSDQKARLRKILAQKAGRAASKKQYPKQELSTNSQSTAERHVSSAKSNVSTPHYPTTTSAAVPPRSVATSYNSVTKEDQKAMLRKILAKSSAKRQTAVDKPSRSSLMPEQQKSEAREPLTAVHKPARRHSVAAPPVPARRESVSVKRSSPRSTLARKATERRESLANRKPQLKSSMRDSAPQQQQQQRYPQAMYKTPVQAPVKPVHTPAQPAPAKPILQAPVKPVQVPTRPLQAPVKPVQVPMKPIQAPLKPIQVSMKRDADVKKAARKISPRARVLQSMAAKREKQAKESVRMPQQGLRRREPVVGRPDAHSGARKSETVKNHAASRSIFATRRPSLSNLKVVTHPVPVPVQQTDRISSSKLTLPSPDEDLESYQAFFGTLQNEVSGDHKELWRSFRSIFHEGDATIDEKKKRVKFDNKTKRQLTEMNLHLKRTSKMECKPVTQLVNDKKYRKGEVPRKNRRSHVDRSKFESTPALSFGRSMSSESETRSEVRSEASSHVRSETSNHSQKSSASEMERQKSWLASFREKSQQKHVKPTKDAPQDQPARQPSWLTIHRQRQERARQASLQTEVGDEEEERMTSVSDHSSGVGQKRRMEEESAAPAWAAMKLRSSKPARTVEEEEQEGAAVPWSGVQLRGTKAHEDTPAPYDERDSLHVEEEKEPQHAAIDCEQPRSDNSEDKAPFKAAFQNRSTAKKPPLVKSFVPASSNATRSVPWGKPKLKRTGVPPSEGGNDCGESGGATPWGNIKLKHRQPPKADKPFDQGAAFLQVLKKTQSFGDVQLNTPSFEEMLHDDSNGLVSPRGLRKSQSYAVGEQLDQQYVDDEESFIEEPEMIESSTEEVQPTDSTQSENPSRSDIQNSLSSMFAARQGLPAPRVEKPEPAEDDNPSRNDIQNSLSSMFAARQGVRAPRVEQPEPAEDTAPGKPSQLELKSALSSMLAKRNTPAPKPPSPEPSQKPSQSEIKGALANMFAARLNPPGQTDTPKECLKVGDEIDFDDVSPELQRKLGDFDTIELSGSIGEVVVLGSELIVVATSEGFSKRVIWYHERDSIDSITLDLAHNVAELLLADQSQKSLKFQNAEGCLRFATCFYQAPTAVPTPATTSNDVPVESSGGNAHLSQEEQEVLMRYRAARKSKDADGAMQETIGGDMPQPKLDLSDDERAVVEKYKKMLKMRIPPEAVQHKMTKDGVEQKIVDIVLNINSGDESRVSSSASGLTADEEKIADSYRKMLKMRIPPEAVQHKMTKDGIDQKIVSAVFDDGSSTTPKAPEAETPKTKLSEEDEKAVASYRKMLKMCIPPEAIRHKMKKDQANESVVFAVFPEDAKKAAASASPKEKPALSPEDAKIATSYEKMLKMRIPPEAVRHKMIKDGVNALIIAAVLGEDTPKTKSSNTLTAEEQKSVASYKKMLKMNFPEEAIRHRMGKEGANEKVVAAVFGSNTKATAKGSKDSALRGSKLVALHWTPLSGDDLDDSVWRANKKRKVAVAQPGTTDISQLIELFKKKSNPKGGAVAATNKSTDTSGKAKLVDLTRANNVAISLKAFKDFSHKQLAETIAYLDPQELIVGERVQFMKDLLPNLGEAQAVKAYKGEDSRLVPAELFFKHIVGVKRTETKVEIMQTMVAFRTNAAELQASFIVLKNACLQVQTSEKLQDVLDMVLHVGNIMNEGTRTGGAAGFKFDSLLKLTQTKSADGKTTVLDYLVMIFDAKNKRDTLDLKGDFPDCQDGSRILVSDLNSEVKSMTDALKQCRTELTQLKKETGKTNGEQPDKKVPATFDPRAGLFAAIQARGSQSEQVEKDQNSEEGGRPEKLKLDVIEENGKKETSILDAFTSCTNPDLTSVDDEGSPGIGAPPSPEKQKREATLEGGIARLEDFINEAEETLAKVKKNKQAAMDACKSLSKYCGEGGAEKAATSLLGTLSQFASNLSDAVKKHDRRKELEAKKEAQRLKREQQEKRRKTFVESKGFGSAASSSRRLDTQSDQSAQDEVNDVSAGVTITIQGNGDANQANVNVTQSSASQDQQSSTDQTTNVDVSQMQGDAKAKVVPKSKDGSSLVLMVNKMLKEASETTREDFENGMVYEDINDETLQAIYQKERQSISSAFASPPRRKRVATNLDLLSAIKQRREEAD